ncbi:MAG: alpha/beta hydrolase [Pseudomonadales bacterium]|nr:alpha/beta hydrolase [Pseudomonadales bacterium]
MWIFVITATILVILFLSGPRPRLDPTAPETRVPSSANPRELGEWLDDQEKSVGGLIDGAEACIEWANPDTPDRTPLCFMYVHGFSATRQETAPVTERIAAHFGANVLYLRIAGHGVGPEGMLTATEDWLQSMVDGWSIASRLGDRVVLIATSTGAPLSIWLASQYGIREKLHAMLFMSPNFRIMNRYDFLLTWPWSRYWLQWIIGKTHSWEAVNEEHAKYWSNHYSTLALIEMQKMVNWVRHQDLSRFEVPLALMYMENDPVVDSRYAVRAFHEWGAKRKRLIPVEPDGEAAEHVFVGRITAPHRIDWCSDQFIEFLDTLNKG